MYTVVQQLADSLHGKLIAAAATPMTEEGGTDPAVTRRYFDALIAGGAHGLAVAVHTGRGATLDLQKKRELVEIARSTSPLVVTGIAASRKNAGSQDWPVVAAQAGASALLVFADGELSVEQTLERYDELWAATGLPLIAFDLYTAPYELDDLRLLLSHEAVAAFKPARLYDSVACQDGIAAAVELGRTVLTGEDRMLGPSLMWGATGALAGIAAASVAVTAAVVRAHHRADAAAFLASSAAVDALAAVTFRQPWDGYVQRMLWIAADEGIIPEDMAFDPERAPLLSDQERVEVIATARRARSAIEAITVP